MSSRDAYHAAAQRKHVPVISYDRLIKNSPVALYISFDNVQVGKLQASALLAIAHSGNYFLLEGPQSDNNALQFEKGQRLALKEAEGVNDRRRGLVSEAGSQRCLRPHHLRAQEIQWKTECHRRRQ